MISILVCSVDPQRLSAFKKNIEDSIGIAYEILFFDNRTEHWGLSKVYNHLSKQAKYDFLCFCHEDVEFLSNNWGNILISQAQQPDCGVVGFAGSKAKSKTFSGWGGGNHRNRRFNLTEVNKQGFETVFKKSYGEEPFSEVLVLDGFCLFVRKQVWAEFPFDELVLSNFHLYDLDFSLQIAQKYKNYVNQNIKVRHFSSGSYSQLWLDETRKFHEKWESRLPAYMHKPSKYKITTDELKAMKDFMRLLSTDGNRSFLPEIEDCIRLIKKKYFLNHYGLRILFNYYFRHKI